MSRTQRDDKRYDSGRSVNPYRRAERRRLLQEFEREYRGRNRNPMIEL
ncbi:MAG TPA: hypothetical protein VF597_04185 [Candidatus Saccharimonadales bacterium]|jgi:hypothetical protein